MEVFEKGAKGVMLVACPEGLCHYINGTEAAEKIVIEAKKILDKKGIGSEKLIFVPIVSVHILAHHLRSSVLISPYCLPSPFLLHEFSLSSSKTLIIPLRQSRPAFASISRFKGERENHSPWLVIIPD